LPIEILFGNSFNFFLSQSNRIYVILISLFLCIYLLFLLRTFSKIFNEKHEAKRNKNIIISLVFISIILIYFAFAIIVMALKFNYAQGIFKTFEVGILNLIANLISVNLLLLVDLVILGISFIALLIALISLIIYFNKSKNKQVQTQKLYFYSSQYEQQEVKEKVDSKQQVIEEEIKDIPESNQNAKDLITKIMQLENLRAEGKISDREYIRLRERSIRRYKRKWENFSQILKNL